jgi:hypothetical protein
MYSCFWEFRGLNPNFHIHVSVSDLYIPRISPHIFLQQNKQINRVNILIIHRYMNVEIRTGAGQFLFWEYIFVSNLRYWFFAVQITPYYTHCTNLEVKSIQIK